MLFYGFQDLALLKEIIIIIVYDNIINSKKILHEKIYRGH